MRGFIRPFAKNKTRELPGSFHVAVTRLFAAIHPNPFYQRTVSVRAERSLGVERATGRETIAALALNSCRRPRVPWKQCPDDFSNRWPALSAAAIGLLTF